MRHLGFTVLVALLLVGNATAAPSGAHAYISNAGVTNLSRLDVGNNDVSAVPMGVRTHGVAVDSSGKRVYATEMTANFGSLYATSEAGGTPQSIVVGRSPFGVAVSPDGRRVYVTHNGTGRTIAGGVAVVDVAATGAMTLAVNLPLGGAATGVAVSPNGNRVYVANAVGRISVIDAAQLGAAPVQVFTGGSLVGLAVSPDGTRLYAADSPGRKLLVLDTARIGSGVDPVLGSVTVGTSPFGVAVSPDGRRVFVANSGSNNVSVVDPSLLGSGLNPVVAAPLVGNGPHGIAVTSDGSRIYVVNRWSHTLSILGRNGEPILGPDNRPLAISLGNLSFPVGFGTFVTVNQLITVQIDIRPASINTKAQGTVPVILFGATDFDVSSVNLETVKLAGAPVAVRGNGPMAQFGDWNDDGLLDVMLHFENGDIKADAVRAMEGGGSGLAVDGETFDGVKFEGTDAVRIVK